MIIGLVMLFIAGIFTGMLIETVFGKYISG
jgi:hypothetical protein